jgi:hypothetical protein
MEFRQILGRLMFWKRGEVGSEDMMDSIVLLMRDAHAFTEAELRDGAERGWGKRFDGKEDPMYFVSRSDVLTVIKAGKYVVQLVQAKHPYS